jgi:very-short-patch-repair endonuclease
MERKMFFGAYPAIFATAKNLRKNMTPAEKLLWEQLSNNKLGFRFKPQHPMIHYIADFYSYELKLIIEVDGPIHEATKEDDEARTKDLEQAGNRLIRFTNEEVFNHLPEVLNHIKKMITEIKTQKLNLGEKNASCF